MKSLRITAAIFIILFVFIIVACDQIMPITKITVTLINYDDSVFWSDSIELGKEIKLPDSPTRKGYTFVGWGEKDSNEVYNFKSIPTENLVLYSIWNINSYTVTFECEEDVINIPPKEKVEYNSLASKPSLDPEKEGHIFIGWSKNAEGAVAYDFSEKITDDITLYPIWERGQYKVSFICEEGVTSIPNNQAITYGEKVSKPEESPSKLGHLFIGWKQNIEDEEFFDFESIISEDLSLYPIWEEKEITVSFYDGKRLIETRPCKFGIEENFPTIVLGDGFELKWKKEGEVDVITEPTFTIPLSDTVTYKYVAFVTSDLLTIDEEGTIHATNKLKNESRNRSLVIPNTMNGINVTAIGDIAFENCKSLTDIAIPDTISSIGNGAFRYCSNLTSISIGKGVTKIGSEAFYGCNNLIEVHADSFSKVEWRKLVKDASLAGNVIVYLKDGCTDGAINYDGLSYYLDYVTGNRYVWAEDKSITEANIKSEVDGDPVTSIKGLGKCQNLISVSIPQSITSIENSAFVDCSNLESIIIPDSVTHLGAKAFQNCTGLKNITLGKSIKEIEYWTFMSCSSLTSIAIPDSVTSIQNYAFVNCTNLENISLGNGVNRIAEYAFKGCNKIKKLIIPSSVTFIEGWAFCESLDGATVEIEKGLTTIGPYAFLGSSMTSITIPESVVSIQQYAFNSCRNLTSVSIPDSVKSIGICAFSECEKLKTVNISSSVEIIETGAFQNSYDVLSEIRIDKPKDSISGAPWGSKTATVKWKGEF